MNISDYRICVKVKINRYHSGHFQLKVQQINLEWWQDFPNKKKNHDFLSLWYIVDFLLFVCLFHFDVDTKICLESKYVYLTSTLD